MSFDLISSPGVRKRVANGETTTFLLNIPKRKLEKVKQLAQWYREHLKVKVSVAYLIRESIDDFIDRETRLARKAERGRFHAKVRNQNQ